MRLKKQIVSTLLLMTAYVICYSGNLSDSICISYAERDTIFARLNACRELPVLKILVLRQENTIAIQNSLIENNGRLIDTMNAQIADYSQIVHTNEKEKKILTEMLNAQKKITLRNKIVTAGVITPISFVIGMITGIIITR